jgi:hypothetical protein
MLVILAAKGSARSAFGIHATTALVMVLAAIPLMMGRAEMVHAVSVWLFVVGFFGAGLVNAIGTAATQSSFARWGYPHWWGY